MMAAAYRHGIAPGQDAMIRAMLAPDDLPDGWQLSALRITLATIEAGYTAPSVKLQADVQLCHPETGESPYRTAKFCLRGRLPPGAGARDLLRALTASIRRQEGAFRWRLLPRSTGATRTDLPWGVTPMLLDVQNAAGDGIGVPRSAFASSERDAIGELARAVESLDSRADRLARVDAVAGMLPSGRPAHVLVAAVRAAAGDTPGAVEALTAWTRDASDPSHARSATLLCATFEANLGRYRESLARLDDWLAAHPSDPEALWLVAMLRAHRGDGDGAWTALERLDAQGDLEAPHARLMAGARLLDCGLEREGAEWLRRVACAPHGEVPEAVRDEALDRWFALGSAADVEQALATMQDGAGAHGALVAGEIATWRGRIEAARAHAETARRMGGPAARIERLLGTIAWLEGDTQRALEHLDRAVEGDPRDAAALLLRAEARVAVGRTDDAHADVVRGSNLTHDSSDHLPAQLVRLCVLDAQGQFPGVPDMLVREALEEIVPGVPREPAGKRVAEALRRMRGNRTARTTWVDPVDGSLRTLPRRVSPRVLARQVQYRYSLTADLEAALRAFDALVVRFPDTPETWNYRGEIHLWRGEWEAAEACFRRALDQYSASRWAYIGMGGLHTVAGRPAEGMRWLERGMEVAQGPGPTTYVYRGEALLALGRLDEARADLEHSITDTPSRIGAWVLRCRLARTESDATNVERCLTSLRQRAPGLLADVRTETGLDPWSALAPRDVDALIEALLRMLRGNRASSCVTYFTAAGTLRCVPSDVPDPSLARTWLRALGRALPPPRGR